MNSHALVGISFFYMNRMFSENCYFLKRKKELIILSDLNRADQIAVYISKQYWLRALVIFDGVNVLAS